MALEEAKVIPHSSLYYCRSRDTDCQRYSNRYGDIDKYIDLTRCTVFRVKTTQLVAQQHGHQLVTMQLLACITELPPSSTAVEEQVEALDSHTMLTYEGIDKIKDHSTSLVM